MDETMKHDNDNHSGIRVLDLFSAAAGGWSLGMHRAGYRTIAACEFEAWRRALYSQNNPGVPIYDDVRKLTAERLIRDGVGFPDVIVGSPPCQDISSANTKGKGVEGARSGLYFEAVRIIGECRPRWVALENSSNLRTRGADAVLAALEAFGYTCWPFVVRAGDIGANHDRSRSWLIGCDLTQVANSDGFGRGDKRRRSGFDLSVSEDIGGNDEAPNAGQERPEDGAVVGSICPSSIAEARRPDGRSVEARDDADAAEERPERLAWRHESREGEIPECADLSPRPEMGLRTADCGRVAEWRADWSLDDLAAHLQLDDGLSAWVAGTRIAVGGPKGTSAASLIVEAFGDAVVPQIPEAIGRAIVKVERALQVITANDNQKRSDDNSLAA